MDWVTKSPYYMTITNLAYLQHSIIDVGLAINNTTNIIVNAMLLTTISLQNVCEQKIVYLRMKNITNFISKSIFPIETWDDMIH